MKVEDFKRLVIKAAEEVFEKMISLSVSGDNGTDASKLFQSQLHLCATIGFAGDWNGFISLQCGEKLAYLITSKMLFMDPADLEKADVWDALGEVVNMVGGKFKAIFAIEFNDGVEAFKMSVPSVIMGKNYQLYVLGNNSIPETVLACEGEKFSLKLVLKKTERS